jgi:hypothetical protein
MQEPQQQRQQQGWRQQISHHPTATQRRHVHAVLPQPPQQPQLPRSTQVQKRIAQLCRGVRDGRGARQRRWPHRRRAAISVVVEVPRPFRPGR